MMILKMARIRTFAVTIIDKNDNDFGDDGDDFDAQCIYVLLTYAMHTMHDNVGPLFIVIAIIIILIIAFIIIIITSAQ